MRGFIFWSKWAESRWRAIPERYWLVKRFRVWRDCLIDSWTKLNVVDTRINATSSDANLNFERGDLWDSSKKTRKLNECFRRLGESFGIRIFLCSPEC